MDITQGTIPSDWTGEYCCYAVEWPNSPQWLAVLRGVLALPAKGRFWDEHTGNIIEAQNVVKETYDNNLHLREVIMACNDPNLAGIAAALTQIAQALNTQSQNCCDNSGSGGAGTVQPPFVETPETDPNVDPPPTGFETWEEFFAQKCAIAYDIINTLEQDLGNMAIINFGSISLSSLAALVTIVIATPVPFDDIIAVAGLLLTVAAEVILTTALDIINTNEGDLICELYNGTDSSTSRSMFLSLFNSLVDNGVTDPIENFAIKSLIAYMLGAQATNRLYEKDLSRNWTAQDCSGCGTGAFDLDRLDSNYAVIAELFSPSEGFFTMQSHSEGAFHSVYIQVNNGSHQVEFQNLTGHTPSGVGLDFDIGQNAPQDIFAGEEFAAFQTACIGQTITTSVNAPFRQWGLISATFFTVEAKIIRIM